MIATLNDNLFAKGGWGIMRLGHGKRERYQTLSRARGVPAPGGYAGDARIFARPASGKQVFRPPGGECEPRVRSRKAAERVVRIRFPHQQGRAPFWRPPLLVGEGGFGPPKSETTDLQSAPFGHSGIPPYSVGSFRNSRIITDGAGIVKTFLKNVLEKGATARIEAVARRFRFTKVDFTFD